MPRRRYRALVDADDFGLSDLPSHNLELAAHAEESVKAEPSAKIVSHPSFLHPAFSGGKPSPQTILTLQRQHGNQAVQRWVTNYSAQQNRVSRQATAAPAPKNPSAERLFEDYKNFYWGLGNAQQRNPSIFRQQLAIRLDRELPMAHFTNIGGFDHPTQHSSELAFIQQKLDELKEVMRQEKILALREHARLGIEKMKAHEELQAQGRSEHLYAGVVLDEMDDKIRKQVSDIGEYVSLDDVYELSHMLGHKTYLKQGVAKARSEEEKLKAEAEKGRKEMERLKDEKPGFFKTLWSVVGWEDFGDFMIDALLTVGTAGAGKVARGAYKARKARKIIHARKAIRMARRLKRAQKVKELGEAAKTAVSAIKKDPDQIKDMASWVLDNSSAIGRKIITDFIANGMATATTGKDQSQSSILTARPRKEYIQYMVDQSLGLNSELSKDYVQMMFWAYATGREATGTRMLRAFFSVALKRRGLANLIHATINHTGKLDFPDNSEDFKAIGLDFLNVAISTTGEMINDFVMALPYFDEYRSTLEPMVETARKTLVNLIRTEIGS